METQRSKKKTVKYLLANHDGIEIYLAVPTKEAQSQKYYLDYNYNGQKKYYGNGSVKRRTVEFFRSLVSQGKLKQTQIEAQLTDLFKQDIEIIIHEVHIEPKEMSISMKSLVRNTIQSFFAYKTLQCLEGTIEKRALGNYAQYHRKLLRYFELKPHYKHTLVDLSTEFWLKYRISLLNNEHGINTKVLCNASINQHYQYITQFYGWLIDYNELPIRNHLKKLKKLNEAKQTKRFKVLPDQLLNEFYSILEHKEKVRYTSLYLAALLLYENNIRLYEQVLVKTQHIDLNQNRLSVLRAVCTDILMS